MGGERVAGADEEAGCGEVKKPAWIWLAAAALAVQVAGLGALVARYERVVTKGTEVRIPCGAFDPVDVLRGRYLHVRATRTCREIALETPVGEWEWNYLIKRRKPVWALLEMGDDGVHRIVRVAEKPDGDGVWIATSKCSRVSDENEPMRSVGIQIGFPGKLFMDERLAKAADRVFARREGEAVAVYRAWKGEMVITDVEIDGVSVKELARRARAAEAGKKAGT